MTFVLDTCALLFWTLEPERLSGVAATSLRRLTSGAPGLICSATIWEIALKERAGRLDLGIPSREYLRRVRLLPLEIVDVDASLWIDSVELDWHHRDPVDRLVVALARREGATIITSDAAIRAFDAGVAW